MITKQQYVEYLLATPGNYTCSYLAEHLDATSHDAVSDYLRRERHTARDLWELAEPLIRDGPNVYLILDDSVQNKAYSRKIEFVKRQYSGAEHGLVRGIGVVNLVHTSGKMRPATDPATDAFYPIDFRIYEPVHDGKTKNDHFLRRRRRRRDAGARLRGQAHPGSDGALRHLVRLGRQPQDDPPGRPCLRDDAEVEPAREPEP
jgi:hypothetical protein